MADSLGQIRRNLTPFVPCHRPYAIRHTLPALSAGDPKQPSRQLTQWSQVVCLQGMFVPPTIGPNNRDGHALDATDLLLQHPGLPPEIWTPQARGRTWIYTTGSLGVLGIFFALATWYLDSLHREGMFGLVVILAFFLWIGCNGLGALTGLVAMLVTTSEDRKVALYTTLLNVIPPCAVYFFLHK